MTGTTSPIRDQRVEDPSNTWVIDPLARTLVPIAVRLRVPANAISFAGLVAGGAAALAFERWRQPEWVILGLAAAIVWLVFDSLDGMVARATGTASAFGRELDGLCDHGVFAMLYLALAQSAGGGLVWGLAAVAAVAHALQANIYETERDRFHRRLRGLPGPERGGSANPLVRLYDFVAAQLDRASAPFDRMLASASGSDRLLERYREAVVPAFRMMLPLSQNMRIAAIFVACLMGRITLFLWYEIVVLSLVAALGMLLHREVETRARRRRIPSL